MGGDAIGTVLAVTMEVAEVEAAVRDLHPAGREAAGAAADPNERAAAALSQFR